MACVRIRFIASNDFVGRSIRFFTHSLFEHVEFGTPEGTWIGAHADSGIEERKPDYCSPSREYVYEIPCSDYESDLLMEWCRSKLHIQYNYLDILGMLIRRRQWTSPKRLICSQFVTEGMLEVFGAHRFLNVLADWSFLVTPEMTHLSPMLVGHLVKKVGS